MADTKFKVGDEVEVLNGRTDSGECDIKNGRIKVIQNGCAGLVEVHSGRDHSQHCLVPLHQLRLLRSATKVAQQRQAPAKFILQYELNSDPFELFSTELELRKRIAELAAKPDLKRDSIKVYDIKRVRTVELGVKITIK